MKSENPNVSQEPQVDRSRDRITYGRPDLDMLRQFCSERFGWLPSKTSELLEPVAKAFDQRETQRRMDQFFSYNQRFAKIRSERLQRAVKGISARPNPDINLQPDELSSAKANGAPNATSGSKGSKRKAAAADEADASRKAPEKAKKGTGRSGSGTGAAATPADEAAAAAAPDDAPSSRGRGRTRGRGRGNRGRGRGRASGISSPELQGVPRALPNPPQLP